MSAYGWHAPMDEPPGPPPVTVADLLAAQARVDAEIIAARMGQSRPEAFKAALSDLVALYDRATPVQQAEALEAMSGQRHADDVAATVLRRRHGCGCPPGTGTRTVSKFDRATRTPAGSWDAVTVCAGCGEEVEL